MKSLVAAHTEHLFLKPAEVFVVERPSLITTVLGSCVAVTMFDPARGIGAICHAMLPRSSGRSDDLRYVDVAIPYIYRKMRERGASGTLEVKLFGGARVLNGAAGVPACMIGEDNIVCAEKVLEELGLSLSARDVGGSRGRRLFFCTRKGDVYLRRVRQSRLVNEERVV